MRNRGSVGAGAWRFVALFTSVMALAGCVDGGFEQQVDDTTLHCRALDPDGTQVEYGCIDCEVSDAKAATDHSAHTYSSIQIFTSAETQGVSISSSTFFLLPEGAGSRPGAFLTLPENTGGILASVVIRIRTYWSGALMQEEQAQMGATVGVLEGTLQMEDVPGNDPTLPRHYVYFTATQAFDVVSVEVSAPGLHEGGATETKIYGLCSDGAVIR